MKTSSLEQIRAFLVWYHGNEIGIEKSFLEYILTEWIAEISTELRNVE